MEDLSTAIGYTIEQRKKGLPKEYIIFQNNEDFGLSCLDTSLMENDECPVIIWDRWNNKIIEKTNMNFEQFLEKDIIGMLEYEK